MIVTCDKDLLINGINIVSKAVSGRTTLPILECILINASKGNITLTASDLEIGIKTAPIPADIDQEGEIAIEARLFSEIVKRLNDSKVTIITSEKEATIKSACSEFTLMTQNAEDFPEIPKVEKDSCFKLKQIDLKNMINSTIFSVAVDESKPFLTGEYIEFKKDCTNVVAVDGFRISCMSSYVSNEKESGVIIPAKTMREISRILSNDDESEVEIFVTDKHVLFNIEQNTVVSRTIDGEYIKYEQTFTDKYKTKLVADRIEFISSLERASIISRDARKMPVKIEIKDNIVITSQTEIGKVREEISAEIQGEELNIAFNPRYLIEALKSIEDDNIIIQFNSHIDPCIIKPQEGNMYKYLILPLRV